MPIYAYRCAACGHAKDMLQKLSDPPLTTCPACGAETFRKQLTAAGFQLKGSGWYVTDFRGNGQPPAPAGGNEAPAPSAAPDSSPAVAPAPGKEAAAAPAAPSAPSNSSSNA
jgi:putative FmdB family regulatory protein